MATRRLLRKMIKIEEKYVRIERGLHKTVTSLMHERYASVGICQVIYIYIAYRPIV